MTTPEGIAESDDVVYTDPSIPLSDKPPRIKSMDEMLTREEFAERWKISPKTVDQWRYGRGGIFIPLPYFRFANKIYLWEGGIIWWMNKQAERPDMYRIDRMRRLKEGKKVGRTFSRRNS